MKVFALVLFLSDITGKTVAWRTAGAFPSEYACHAALYHLPTRLVITPYRPFTQRGTCLRLNKA